MSPMGQNVQQILRRLETGDMRYGTLDKDKVARHESEANELFPTGREGRRPRVMAFA